MAEEERTPDECLRVDCPATRPSVSPVAAGGRAEVLSAADESGATAGKLGGCVRSRVGCSVSAILRTPAQRRTREDRLDSLARVTYKFTSLRVL